MSTVKLTHKDINEMVRRAVHAVLNESVKEAQGSIVAEKEDVIQEIVDYVEKRWERIKETNKEPDEKGTYTFNKNQSIPSFPSFDGVQENYIILVPAPLTDKLNISENFEINVAVLDYSVPQEMLKYFGQSERGTEGTSYGGNEYNKFTRSTMKVSKSRIDMYVPAVNGELQVQGFYSTLYHELNHTASRLEIQKKHQYLDDDSLEDLHFFTASRRQSMPPHYITAATMKKSGSNGFWGLFGMGDPELEEEKRKISFIFYALWEITERNARAEAIYGDLKALKATRANFREVYPETEVCRQIHELEESIEEFEKKRTPASIWTFAAEVMNMHRRGKNTGMSFGALKRFHNAVKERFISRSRELLDVLYKKAMKVAELYLQRTDPKPEPTRLERYKQEHNK